MAGCPDSKDGEEDGKYDAEGFLRAVRLSPCTYISRLSELHSRGGALSVVQSKLKLEPNHRWHGRTCGQVSCAIGSAFETAAATTAGL